MKAEQFLAPSAIFYGPDSLEEAQTKVAELGTRALLVTDKIMEELKYVAKVKKILAASNLDAVVYSEVNQEPNDQHVSKGVSLYQQKQCDFIIALGGGSPIDAAKAIGAMLTNSGSISDYMGLGKIKNAIPPLVAIPTTAGTGSEVTQYTIINDTANDVKMLIGSPELIPEVAIVDPLLTLSVPAEVTAATAVDALTHAIEGYTSVKHQPLTDTLALSAIERIANYLEQAYVDGSNIKARSQLMLAAMEAGMVINNSSVTLVHGLSRPIGALFHLAHGISNAVLLGDCLEYASEGNPERFAKVAQKLGVDDLELTDLEMAQAGVAKVNELCSVVNIPSISELGVNRNKFIKRLDKMAEDALNSGSPANTYRQPSKKEIIGIYKKLIN
jgi:1,3-propanediol dehydrogenase